MLLYLENIMQSKRILLGIIFYQNQLHWNYVTQNINM